MKSLCLAFLASVLVLSLAVPAGFAASQPQPQTQQTAPADQSQPQTAPADQSQQSQTQEQQQTTSSDDEDKAPTDVKPGTEKDVNSIGNRGVGKGMNLYSLEREIALGKQAAMEVEKTSKLITDPVVTEYVNRIGQNLVRNSDAKVPFTIKVIDTDEINAFALPGGFFYVNSGLILAADNEAELAGVMAHEIAHVAACHVAREQTRSNIVNLASIPLIFVPGGWAVYEATQAALSIGVPLTFMKFSRNFESEADFLGMEYMDRK